MSDMSIGSTIMEEVVGFRDRHVQDGYTTFGQWLYLVFVAWHFPLLVGGFSVGVAWDIASSN